MNAIVKALAVIVCLGFGPGHAFAADHYPSKPIRLIVAFPPGGSSDTIARVVQPGLIKELGQQVIVENRPGAGGMIAIDYVAKSAPNGYVIGLGGAGALGTNLGLEEKMTYDPTKDVIPITGLASSPFILAAAPSMRGKSLRDIIAMAKMPGNTVSIGHGGNGTLMHLTAAMLNQKTGANFTLVPYRGIAPVVSDLIGDHIALGIIDPPSGMAAIKAGAFTALAMSSATRFSRMPNVPTIAESGLPGFESTGWFGIVAPAKTPPDIIAKINKAFVKTLSNPAVSEFSTFIKKEIDKWLKVEAEIYKKPR
jgi:tripartite-type tricarboxylate transporter receptor subunit TctC